MHGLLSKMALTEKDGQSGGAPAETAAPPGGAISSSSSSSALPPAPAGKHNCDICHIQCDDGEWLQHLVSPKHALSLQGRYAQLEQEHKVQQQVMQVLQERVNRAEAALQVLAAAKKNEEHKSIWEWHQGSGATIVPQAGAALVNGNTAPRQSLCFPPGGNAHATLPGLPAIGGAITIVLAVRCSSFRKNARFFDFATELNNVSDSVYIAHDNANSIRAFMSRGSSESAVYISDFCDLDKWMHVVFTVNREGMMRVYKNGELRGAQQTSFSLRNVARKYCNFGLTNWPGNSDPRFHGYLSDIEVYNSSFSGDQVEQSYEAWKAANKE